MKKGIKESKELVVFAGAFLKSCMDAYKDGKLTFSDYTHFTDDFSKGVEAFKGVDAVGAELKDLSEDEISALLNAFSSEIGDSSVKEDIQDVFTIAQSVLSLVKRHKK